MKLILLSIFITAAAVAESEKFFAKIDSDAIKTLSKEVSSLKVLSSSDRTSIVEAQKSDLGKISHLMHDKFYRCGGFTYSESFEEAKEQMEVAKENIGLASVQFNTYEINSSNLVEQAIGSVREDRIYSSIDKLSSYQNRYYDSQHGVDSQLWIKNTWEKIGFGRSDFRVELFEHRTWFGRLLWKQPSVVATLEGSTKKDEIVIVGGHGDSIIIKKEAFGHLVASRDSEQHAPGADDNASGIATVTEVLQVLIDSNYKPERTIKFISYSAEEVGLRGSAAIAKHYKKQKLKVVGVLQLDMTNFKGGEKDFYLVDDFTNPAQNQFIGKLIDQYLGYSWGYTSCGYGCSDHASWFDEGFSASFPTESKFLEGKPQTGYNSNVHTSSDTLEALGGVADVAVKYTKLGVAYVIEMSK